MFDEYRAGWGSDTPDDPVPEVRPIEILEDAELWRNYIALARMRISGECGYTYPDLENVTSRSISLLQHILKGRDGQPPAVKTKPIPRLQEIVCDRVERLKGLKRHLLEGYLQFNHMRREARPDREIATQASILRGHCESSLTCQSVTCGPSGQALEYDGVFVSITLGDCHLAAWARRAWYARNSQTPWGSLRKAEVQFDRAIRFFSQRSRQGSPGDHFDDHFAAVALDRKWVTLGWRWQAGDIDGADLKAELDRLEKNHSYGEFHKKSQALCPSWVMQFNFAENLQVRLPDQTEAEFTNPVYAAAARAADMNPALLGNGADFDKSPWLRQYLPALRRYIGASSVR